MKSITKFAVAVAALATISAAATAQSSVTNITVSATVTASFATSNGGNLTFPTVIQGGSASTILPSGSGAGKVNIVGANSAGITMTATTLPSTLAGPAASTLGISAWQYCYTQTNSNSACTPTSVASGGTISGQNLSSTGAGYLWIGATLAAPGAAQTVGGYTGTAVITVTTP